MRLVTNPATNLPPEQLEADGIVMMPQQIVVDEVHHDTRDDVTLQTIDNWIRSAKARGVPNDARRLADTLAETFDVRRQFTVPLAPSIYLHTGRGALALGVVPLDGLSWVPNGPAGTGR
jgi:fatty acid-binding protein DegV